jgi:hypothetical protein
MLETMLTAKTLIEDSFDDEHDMRKSEFDDFVEYFVLFWNDARNDFNNCLTDLVLDDFKKINALWVCCFFDDDVDEIRCDEWKKEQIN